jgi:2,3-bisphosphoglycerate-dependent phosphoglycerate mutase
MESDAQTRAERRQMQEEMRRHKTLSALSGHTCELLLIRHGETYWNKERRLQGDVFPGPELTLTGQKQSVHLAGLLAVGKPIHAIYTSDLLRAVQTTNVIVDTISWNPVVRKASHLRERRLGSLQGLTIAEATKTHPQELSLLHKRATATVACDIESREELEARVSLALESIASEHPGQRIAVVTHGGVITAAYQRACKGRCKTPKPVPNCSINTIFIDASAETGALWAVGQWGATEHLGTETTTFGGGGVG